MKKQLLAMAVLSSSLLFAACNLPGDGGQRQAQADKSSEQIAQAKYDWSLPQVVYQHDGKIYFHNPANGHDQLLEEEGEEVFSLIFDDARQTLYYTVVVDGLLGLKKATLVDGKIKIESLKGLGIAKEKFITETYAEYSPLELHGGNLLLMSDFNWDSYALGKYNVYVPGDDTWFFPTEVQEIERLLGGATRWRQDEAQPFTSGDQQLFYTGGKTPVAVSDKLDLKLDPEFAEEPGIGYLNFSVAPDGGKVSFMAVLSMGDLPHGPLCIANADGSGQRILSDDGIARIQAPKWLGGELVFTKPLEEDIAEDEQSETPLAMGKLMMTRGSNNEIKELVARAMAFTLIQGKR